MRTWVVTASLAFALTACADSDAPDDAPVRAQRQAVVTAPTGPGGAPEDYVVIVDHDPGVPPEALDEVVRRVRIVGADIDFEEGDFEPGVVPPGDAHWADPADHAIHVTVRPALPEVALDRLEWVFADHVVADLFCPPGH
ncbi:MAG: hypothetical protein H6704_03960 [Myxococcales bacterium]|nr:hypothetical protein [Myxococcales bacterium]